MDRLAGAFAVDPKTRETFVRSVTQAFAQSGPFEVWNFPLNDPVLTLVFGAAKRPALTRWRAGDGSCAVIDGDFFEIEGRETRKGDNPAELVFNQFLGEGRDAFKRVRADAICILYEAGPRRLTLARDLRGVAQIYYAPLQNGLLFASAQMTLARLVSRTLDTNALDHFLARGYVAAPWTLIREVRKFPSSHTLEASVGGAPKVARYDWGTARPKLSPTRDERNREMDKLITTALRRRHPPGAKSAVLLSGGVDSTLLLAALVRLLGEKPDCFTFEYSDYQGVFNESDEAAQAAAHFGVRHERVVCTPRDLADRAPSLVRAYGEPFTYGLHSFALDRLVGGPSPIFSGTGSEPWGVNRSAFVTSRFRQLPLPARLMGRAALQMAKPFVPKLVDRAHVLLWCDRTGLPPGLAPTLLRDEQRRRLFADPDVADAAVAATYDLLHEALGHFSAESELDRWRFMAQRSFGAEGVYVWYAAWAHNYELQIHHPFLDHDLNAYMMRLTLPGVGKLNERDYATTLLPERFANAPKVFHTIPIGSWFRGPLRDFLCSTLESRALEGVFDKRAVNELLERHLSGRADHAFTLWGLASFALWSKEVLTPSLSPDTVVGERLRS